MRIHFSAIMHAGPLAILQASAAGLAGRRARLPGSPLAFASLMPRARFVAGLPATDVDDN